MIMEEKKIYVMAPYRMTQRKIDFVFGGTPLFLADKALTKFSLSISLLKGVFKVDVNSYLR